MDDAEMRATTASAEQGCYDDHRFIDLLMDLSSRFAGADHKEVGTHIKYALERIVEFFEADRGMLYKVLLSEGSIIVSERVEKGFDKTIPWLLDARGGFPWLFEEIVGRQKTVYIPTIDTLPTEAAQDRESLLAWETRSALFIPLSQRGSADLILALGCRRDHPDWPESLISRLQLLGETLARVLRRKDLEEEREESLQFEQLIARTSADLACAEPDQVSSHIGLALQAVLDYTQNDQGAFFTIFAETGQAYLSHLRYMDGTSPPSQQVEYAAAFPWLYKTIVTRQEIYYFNTRDDLPPEAALDRLHLEALGNRSGLYIPYVEGSVVRYIFALVSNTREQRWSPKLIERLKALGAVFVNALARQRVAEAMLRSKNGLKEAQRIANLGNWERDILTDKVWTSAQTNSIFGARVATYDEFMAAIHPDDRENLRRTIEAGIAGSGTKYRVEHRVCRPDGDERVVENHFEILRSASENRAHVFGTIQDITARRRSEQELDALRAQQWHAARLTQIAVLISSLAHELCQPLTAILSNAQAALRLIRRNGLQTDEAISILEDIVADNKRAGQVIESLRVMLRRRTTERQLIDSIQIASDLMTLLHSEYIKQNVQVEVDLGVGCHIMGDRVQLQQVLINLVMNGMEAMRDRPTGQRRLFLKVSRSEQGQVIFSIADVGTGLKPEDLHRIFDAFWTTKQNGIGMGLAICHSIIEAHGGKIWAENNTGPGATFHFSLPAVVQ